MKRLFDCVAASVGLLCLAPAFAVVAVLIKTDSDGPVFFRQQRIGRGFRLFWIYKFRTMVQDAPLVGAPITSGSDPRITRVGRFLRRTKIDELPQLINVLKGEMSIVGPRPELARYVDAFSREYREILQVRPGITDVASLAFRDEATILAGFANAEEAYVTRILPRKIRLSQEYVRRCSLASDLVVILKTISAIWRPTAALAAARDEGVGYE